MKYFPDRTDLRHHAHTKKEKKKKRKEKETEIMNTKGIEESNEKQEAFMKDNPMKSIHLP